MVVEAEGLHFFAIVEITAVDNQAAAHQVAGFFPIENAIDRPFRANESGVDAL